MTIPGRFLAMGLALACLTNCGDDATIFTVYTDVAAPVGVYGYHRVELRSRGGFGNSTPTVTLDGRALYVTWWTPDVILAWLGPEDRSGKLIVETSDGRTIDGPFLHLGQGSNTLEDAWKQHVENYAARYGFGPGWVSFMKGAYAHYALAFQRHELERCGWAKTVTVAYHYWGESRPAFQKPWAGATEWEQENNHMRALEAALTKFFPGWLFEFSYLDKPELNDVVVYGNWPDNPDALGYASYAFRPDVGRTDYVIATNKGDLALPHEIGHRLGLQHQHNGEGIPPGEKWCLMGWGAVGLCSGCMCALDVDRASYDEAKSMAVWKEVRSQY